MDKFHLWFHCCIKWRKNVYIATIYIEIPSRVDRIFVKYIHFVMQNACKTNWPHLTACCSTTVFNILTKEWHVWKILCVLWRERREYVRRPELFWTRLHTHCFLSPGSTHIILSNIFKNCFYSAVRGQTIIVFLVMEVQSNMKIHNWQLLPSS